MNAAPGWFHAEGDPEGTHRWWDGERWVGGPAPIEPERNHVVPPAARAFEDIAPFPGAPPELPGVGVAHDRSPIEWMLLPLKRYAEFGGRSTRAEYWWFQLLYIGAVVSTLVPGMILAETSAVGIVLLIVGVIVAFGLFIPGLAVSVRRLHDTGRPGGWIAIGMIPIVNYIGSFVLLFFYAQKGELGPNQYGPSSHSTPGVTDAARRF